MKFELYRTTNKQFGWRIRASNGQIVAQSEGYKKRGSALKTIDSIKVNSYNAPTEDRTRPRHFRFRDGKGQWVYEALFPIRNNKWMGKPKGGITLDWGSAGMEVRNAHKYARKVDLTKGAK